MSGFSSSQPCPICNKNMDTYSDYKPYDMVSGECMFCGFSYYTKAEQMSLSEVNRLRKEFNDNNDHLSKNEKLKSLTKKDLNKYKKDIENI